jgi:hypothetical protein
MTGFANQSFVERWQRFSLMEQPGNIGSEVDRVIRWKAANNNEFATRAFYRTLELLDLTIADVRWKGGKRKELTRVREVLCDVLAGDNTYNTPAEYLSRYFFQCALLAQKRNQDGPPETPLQSNSRK